MNMSIQSLNEALEVVRKKYLYIAKISRKYGTRKLKIH
jgi:hypothetical protein